jgi:rubrerythrin
MNTVEIQGISRSAFLVRGALAAGAAYGATAVGPWVARSVAQDGGGDVEILNFALTLEYLEADFYDKASKLSLSKDYKGLASDFGDDEAAHVQALKETIEQLGGKPAAMPTFTFPMKNEKDFVKLAVTLEDTGVSAYNGAAPLIMSKEVLAAAGSIVQVEARHAAALRFRSGQNASEGPFDMPLEMADVLTAVKPFVKA